MKNKKISHFKVVNEIGQGGMGVVYKAEDTKLKRTVALKFLPLNAIASKQEKSRFLREAQAAAALNHANIATIYAIDEEDGQSFIAMEHIEGENLSEIISKGPIKLQKAIDIAVQVALGLQAAHDQGVVHRDIKSANIMLTEKGDVKVMDFGLAKLAGSTMLTKQGMTMGTAGYMSPEQTRGENVDYRTDIWSLGVVLYEMVTGEMPFKGDYEQALIYSILNEEPEPLSALRSRIPMELERIVEKCLAKESGSRYQNATEIPVDLKAIDISSSSSSRISPAASQVKVKPKKKSGFKTFVKRVILTASLAVIAFFVWYFVVSPPEKPVRRLAINADAELNYVPNPTIAISPDGKNLVYVAKNDGKAQLHLRPLQEFESQPIQGTENAHSPFFSPDGEWIGFLSEGKLSKVSLFGGVPIALTDVESFMGASWSPKGDIYFGAVIPAQNKKCVIYKISDVGGEPVAVTSSEEGVLVRHGWPEVIKSGKALLFTEMPATGQDFDKARIEVLNIETGIRKTALEGGIYGRYCNSGQLVAVWSAGLFAAPFDINSLQVTGPTKPIKESVHLNYGAVPNFTFSTDGSLVYVGDETQTGTNQIVQINRKGEIDDSLTKSGKYSNLTISPDGKKVLVVNKIDDEEKIQRVSLNDLTVSELSVNGDVGEIIFSQDKENVTYSAFEDNKWRIFNQSFSNAKRQLLVADEKNIAPQSWSPDGKYLAFKKTESDSNGIDVWLYQMVKKKVKVKPLLQGLFDETNLRFSPSGRFVAYESDKSGLQQIYVQSFPDSGLFAQVSELGGEQPTWSLTGDELFFVSNGRLCSVNLSSENVGRIKKIMPFLSKEINIAATANPDNFITLVSGRDFRVKHFNIVLNWFDELSSEVPSGKKIFSFNF